MKKKIVFLLVIVLAFTIVFAGCSKDNESNDKTTSDSSEKGEDASNKKDSLIIGQDSDAVNLDPQFNGDTTSQRIVINIFDTIVRENSDGEIVPNVAKKWEISNDGLEYIFKLKEGIKYHNGNELTASDIKFTLDRAMDSPHAAELVECVEKTEVIDEYTVKITLVYPYGPFITLLAAPQLAIVNEEIVTKAGDEFARNPVGSGPYKFVEWKAGDKIVLEAFEDFHNGPAPMKKVTFKVIADQSTSLIALENKEIDALINVASIDIENVKNNSDLEFYEKQALRSNFMSINCTKEPFNNPLVRQAIAYTIDKEAILYAATEGIGEVAENHIAVAAFGYTDKVKSYPVDFEKAKGLLAKAGYADGFNTKITVSNKEASKMAQVIQSNLSEIGVNCEIEMLEWGTFLDSNIKGEFDMSISGWGYLAADADQGVYALMHSSQIGGANWTRYKNDRLDELLETGRKSSSPSERLSAYEELTQLLHDEVPSIPFYWTVTNIAANKELKGVKALPLPFYYVHDFSW